MAGEGQTAEHIAGGIGAVHQAALGHGQDRLGSKAQGDGLAGGSIPLIGPGDNFGDGGAKLRPLLGRLGQGAVQLGVVLVELRTEHLVLRLPLVEVVVLGLVR